MSALCYPGILLIIAELSIVPVGTGTSVSKYVKIAIKALEGRGVRVIPGPMSTVLECKDIDLLFKAVKAAHRAVLAAGPVRIVTTLKIDDRTDKDATVDSKLRAILSP
jgi:uncharacterized protein (TIGR00106 family)